MIVGEYLPHALERVQHAVESFRKVQRALRVRINRGIIPGSHAEYRIHIAEHQHQNGHEEQLFGGASNALDHDSRRLEIDDDLRRTNDSQLGEVARNPIQIGTRLLHTHTHTHIASLPWLVLKKFGFEVSRVIVLGSQM